MESQLVIPQSRVKRQKRMETMPLVHIPEEIIVEEILSRLPVKSLLRFKCVSKYWRSVISNPNFHCKTVYESILLLNPKTQTVSLHKIVNLKVVNESSSFPILRNDSNYVGKKTCISNSCNGLFIVGIGESFFLFNPSIRYVVKVLELGFMRHNSIVVVGLVDNKSANDYKVVVRFTRRFNNEKVVVVASLKTKQWAQIIFPFDIASIKAGPTLNGRMHWTVKAVDNNNQNSPSKKIICFDPCTNMFKEFPSPQFKFGNENAIVGLGVSSGCISLVRKSGQTIQVSLMKKYGVRESWTILTTLNLLGQPFLFTKKGEIVGKKKNTTDILAYNTIKNTCSDIYLSNPSNLLGGISFVQAFSSPVDYEWDKKWHAVYGWNVSWLR